jgi:hypothetical protein
MFAQSHEGTFARALPEVDPERERLAGLAPVHAGTWSRTSAIRPSGASDSPFDDSDTRRSRGERWRPYYAHFIRLKVKPGSEMSFEGHVDFNPPHQIGNLRLTGLRLSRGRTKCIASLR